MKKRLLSLLIVLAMVLTMIPTVLADEAVYSHGIWVGGEEVTSENLSGDGWSFDPDSWVLTLDGFSYTGAGYGYADGEYAAIYSGSYLDIELVGENSIKTSESENGKTFYDGIIAAGSLYISGSGSLEIDCDGFGLVSQDDYVEITDTTITVVRSRDMAIAALDGLYIKDSVITITNCKGAGLASYDIYIKNSTVDIAAEKNGVEAEDGTESGYAILGYDTIAISNSSVTAVGGTAAMSMVPDLNEKDRVYVKASADDATATDIRPEALTDKNIGGYQYIKIDPYMEYGIWIDGGWITEDRLYGDGWSFNADTRVLTLNGFVYDGEGYRYDGYSYENRGADYFGAIYAEEDLNLQLLSSNSITTPENVESEDGSGNYKDYCGLYVYGSASITGPGSLEIDAGGDGIYVYDGMTIQGGSTVTVENAGYNGIYVFEYMTIQGGSTVTVENAGYDGIWAYWDMTIQGGSTVTVESAGYDGICIEDNLLVEDESEVTIKNAGSDGIYAEDNIEITDSTITIEIAEDNGIEAENHLTITGSTVSVTSSGADGIEARYKDLKIIDSKVTVEYADDEAIEADDELIISGSTILVKDCGSDALYADDKNLTVTDSEITVNGCGASPEDEGCGRAIYAPDGDITINSGTIRIQGARYAIWTDGEAEYRIIINDGTVEAIGGVAAMSVVPDLSNHPDPQAIASVNIDGSDAEEYSNGDSVEGFKYIRIGEAPEAEEPDLGLGVLPGILGTIGGVLGGAAVPGQFVDVTGHWAEDAIDYCVDEGLMNGVAEGKFAPDDSTTRAMIWTMLARRNGVNTKGDPWYLAGQDWAIWNNVSDGTDPNGVITREQLATMLWRYCGSPAAAGDLSGFGDADAVSAYAEGAMSWAVQEGLMNGMNGQLNPQGTATRGQVATIFMRLMENILF